MGIRCQNAIFLSNLHKYYRIVMTKFLQMYMQVNSAINPSISKISCCYFTDFGIGSIDNPLTDIFLYSHHISV